VAEELLPYTNFDAGERGFPAPPPEKLRAVRVLVATSCSAARLLNAGLPRGHFAAVFVDEAGNAVEPEALAPAACLLAPGQQLVLAGDPRQLGPVVRAPLALRHGLATSLLERLMTTRALYAAGPSGFHPPPPSPLPRSLSQDVRLFA